MGVAERVVRILLDVLPLVLRARLDRAHEMALESAARWIPAQDTRPGIADRILDELAGIVVVDLATRTRHEQATHACKAPHAVDHLWCELLLKIVAPRVVGIKGFAFHLRVAVPPSSWSGVVRDLHWFPFEQDRPRSA